jgi:hypothetical protein
MQKLGEKPYHTRFIREREAIARELLEAEGRLTYGFTLIPDAFNIWFAGTVLNPLM